MATFTPFMQSTEAQNIINNYLGGNYAASPNVNKAGVYRNPIFDLRTEQEKAGTLDPSALYPNPQIDFSVADVPVDPCPPGYELIDGICQPIEKFGQSAYQEKNDDNNQEERPYMSIKEMSEASDYELLKYLDDGWLKGDKFNATIGGTIMPPALGLVFGGQNKMRRDFIINELTRRGYATGVNDKGQNTFNLGNVFGIISNAEAANKGINENQKGFFTPEEINYQIQAKNEADAFSGNPYAQTMTPTEVIADAVASGGTVNPYEVQNINAGTNNNTNYQQYFSNPTTPADNFYDDESGI